MKLLLIETCGSEASLALAETVRRDPVVASVVMPGRTASERLVGHLREAMAEQGWALGELNAIAVVCGPGSFTGVRVGLSAAKGLSEASGVPLIGVSRLALLACAVSLEGQPEKGAGGEEVCAILDAGRGEFYCGRYVDGRLQGESLLGFEQAVELAGAARQAVACEAKVTEAFARVLPDRMLLVPEPNAAAMLPLIRQRLLDGDYDDAAVLDANYLRTSDQQIFSKSAVGASAKVAEVL